MQMAKLQEKFFETWEEEHKAIIAKVKQLTSTSKVVH